MLLLSNRISYVYRVLKARDAARILVLAAFALVAVGIAIGAYIAFLRGFLFFGRDAYFGEALTIYMLEAIFFIVMVLVGASAMVSGAWVLFGSAENAFLLSTPLSRYRLFAARFFENAFASSWPMLLIGMPAVVAFWRAWDISLASLVLFLVVLVVVLLGVISLSSVVDFALVRTLRVIRGAGVVLFIGAVFLISAYLIGRVLLPANLIQLFSAERFDALAASGEQIFAHFDAIPTHVAVRLLFAGGLSPFDSAMLFWILLGTLAAAGALSVLARVSYLRILMRSFEGLCVARPEDRIHARAGFKKFPVLFHGAYAALFEKDVLAFLRSPREMSRAFFLVFMLFLYLFLFRRLPREGLEISPDVLARVLFFNLAVIGYFITTLSLRFVFPLVSLEGKSAWATFTSPLRRTGIFWEKLILGFIPIALAVLVLAVISANILTLHGLGLAVFLRVVLAMLVVLVTIIFVVGASWPNFRDRDPDKLSTTMPGLSATALSLLYVASASYVGFLSLKAYFTEGAILSPVILLLALSNLILLVAFLWLGLRRIKTLDISV